MSRPRLPRPGFTLMEVLIAVALVGLVMELALQGFDQLNKISELSKSKVLARDEAARGLQGFATLMRRAHVVFFTGVPLGDMPGDAAAATLATAGALAPTDFTPTRLPIPPTLALVGNGAATVNYAPGSVSNLIADVNDPIVTGSTMPLGKFRFWDSEANAVGSKFLGLTQRLQTADPGVGPGPLADFDKYFPSPLVYMAQANFDSRDVNAGNTYTIQAANIPISWNFYVIYLAPMAIKDPNDPLLPVRVGSAVKRDQGVVRNSSPPKYFKRSTIPFELHLLTVPLVPAINKATLPPAGDTRLPPYGLQVDTSNPTLIAPAPYEYTQNTVNFDPLPLGSSGYRSFLTNLSSAWSRAASGGRVSTGAANIHMNWSNIGNDPPADQAFLNADTVYPAGTTMVGFNAEQSFGASLASRCSDKVLARYIDPDNVHGTYVRFANPTATSATAPYYNAYNTLVGGTAESRGFLYRTAIAPPRKALIAITTRFRSNRNVPFQFATQSLEVDLEAVARYQGHDRTRAN